MKRNLSLIIVLLVAVVAVALWLEPTRVGWGVATGQAFFEGRPTAYWEKHLHGDGRAQQTAISRLEQGGVEAMPVLAELASADGTAASVRCTALEILGDVDATSDQATEAVLGALADDDPYVQAVAAANLSKIGVPADIAIPQLTPILGGSQTPIVARAISEYRTAALPALERLTEIAQDPTMDTESRWNAIRTIGKIGPPAASAADLLATCLEDPADTVREHAAEAFGDIGPGVAAYVPHLIAVLDDPATRVRRDAVRSLGQLGPPARMALPEMKKLLEDPEEIVREAAANAIRAIAPEELPVVNKEPTP